MDNYTSKSKPKTCNNLNSFSSTLGETGLQNMSKILPAIKNDLTSFSVLYFLNVNANNISNLKQIAEFKLLSYYSKTFETPELNFFLDQFRIEFDVNQSVASALF